MNDVENTCTRPDETALKDMANLSWFETNYDSDTENTVNLFQSMSENDWTFKGYSYLVDGEISVTKKNEYDYLWFEQATDEKNPVNINGYERRVEILNHMEYK